MIRYIIYNSTGRIIGEMAGSAPDDGYSVVSVDERILESAVARPETHYVTDGIVVERAAAPDVEPVSGVVGEPVAILSGVPVGTRVILRPTDTEIAEVSGEVIYTPLFSGTFRVRVIPPWPAQETTTTLTVTDPA